MTFRLDEHHIHAVVLDIEGTTTPVSFVYDTLFPYARGALQAYIGAHLDAPELRETFAQLRDDWNQDAARGEAPPPWQEDDREQRVASIAAYAQWLMDRDRKATGLKALQGHIWAHGYDQGLLHGEVFPDVPEALARWRAAGVPVAIFSSGSVLAQQLLFRTTRFGDLTEQISAYFDTKVGPKISPESYRRIAAALGRAPGDLLFVSDTRAELDAARAAGCATLMCVRPGNTEAPSDYDAASDFSEIQ